MNKMKVQHLRIGVIGKMCSGKTTLCRYMEKYLQEKYNIQIQSLTFAGKVYELAYDLFDMKKKDRKLLQSIGTYMRMIDEDVWVKYVMKQSRSKDVFVEDCRYRNEFDALVENGFLMIKLQIDDEFQLERLMKTYPDTYQMHVENLRHASELDIDGFEEEKCACVLNAREGEEIFQKIRDFLDQYLEEHPEIIQKYQIPKIDVYEFYEYT